MKRIRTALHRISSSIQRWYDRHIPLGFEDRTGFHFGAPPAESVA